MCSEQGDTTRDENRSKRSEKHVSCFYFQIVFSETEMKMGMTGYNWLIGIELIWTGI
jgi:hypothetical protein